MRAWVSGARLLSAGVLVGAVALGVRALAQEEASDSFAGAFTYRTHCLRCHGPEGAGDGAAAENLRFQPPDLRLIARRNKGKFPFDRVRRIVDGRKPVKGYDGSGMPAFGDVFREPGAGFDPQLADLEIRAVVAYVQSLQLR
jgi:mono/diheme cytochrome c family protein